MTTKSGHLHWHLRCRRGYPDRAGTDAGDRRLRTHYLSVNRDKGKSESQVWTCDLGQYLDIRHQDVAWIDALDDATILL